MKLRKREIEIISHNILNYLLEHEFIETDDVEGLEAGIGKTIIDELRVEDNLNDEVRKILEAHSHEMSTSKVEYHSAFKLVKSKLVRERNLIL